MPIHFSVSSLSTYFSTLHGGEGPYSRWGRRPEPEALKLALWPYPCPQGILAMAHMTLATRNYIPKASRTALSFRAAGFKARREMTMLLCTRPFGESNKLLSERGGWKSLLSGPSPTLASHPQLLAITAPGPGRLGTGCSRPATSPRSLGSQRRLQLVLLVFTARSFIPPALVEDVPTGQGLQRIFLHEGLLVQLWHETFRQSFGTEHVLACLANGAGSLAIGSPEIQGQTLLREVFACLPVPRWHFPESQSRMQARG